MRTLLLLFVVALTPTLCKADVVWNGSRYVYVQPRVVYQNYSRDYSKSYNRTDYANGFSRYSSGGYSSPSYYPSSWWGPSNPSYSFGCRLGRSLRGRR